MGRSGVQVEVILLDVFAVVSLGAGDAEEPLFQDPITAVPKGRRENDS